MQCLNGGSIENCTIVNNYCQSVGGVVSKGGGSISNSIIWGNRSSAGGSPNYDYTGSGWSYTHCMLDPWLDDVGNLAAAPQLADIEAGDYRLLPGSPCIDAGQYLPWMEAASDMAGKPRLYGAAVDIGALEFCDDSFACNPVAQGATTALASNRVEFVAAVVGANQNGLYYKWDFDNDGVIDLEGLGRGTVTNTYYPGLYDVRLVVSNSAGEVAHAVRQGLIRVGPTTLYVRKENAAAAPPFSSWTTAAADIQSAIEMAVDGSLILVDAGEYAIANTLDIQRGVTLRSTSGAAATTIKNAPGKSIRILYLSHAEGVVDGFTIKGGNPNEPDNFSNGGGLKIDFYGTVSNCVITANKMPVNRRGAGISLNMGGYVRNCQIVGNGANQLYGGGVYLCLGGLVENCVIEANLVSTTYTGSMGGGAYLNGGGTLRNCLIRNNVNTAGAGGGGVHCATAGAVVNCTIVSNYAATVGGLYANGGGTVINTIIDRNYSATGVANWTASGSGWSLDYCCTTPEPSGEANLEEDPQFVNFPADCHLSDGSPCFNSGLIEPWMANATDLDGLPRILARRVDIGAYELMPPTGTLIKLR